MPERVKRGKNEAMPVCWKIRALLGFFENTSLSRSREGNTFQVVKEKKSRQYTDRKAIISLLGLL